MDNCKKHVLRIAAEVFSMPVEELNENIAVNSIPQWDSISHLNLITALEEKFCTTFDMDVLFEVETLGDFIKLLEDRDKE